MTDRDDFMKDFEDDNDVNAPFEAEDANGLEKIIQETRELIRESFAAKKTKSAELIAMLDAKA